MSKRCAVFTLSLVGSALLTGCVGPNAFKEVALDRDLSEGDVARYEAEWKALKTEASSNTMTRLESTDWWPLGLVAYWRRGTVTRVESANGKPEYHVSDALGIGPLALLYASGKDAVFDANGKRLSTMGMTSVLLGHLAMFHSSDMVLADGRRRQMSSAHLVHHIINLHWMDGHWSFSLFTAPNPIAVEGHSSSSACH